MASNQISAVSIKRLWYNDPIEEAPSLETLMSGVTKVDNVHQDTWTLEESEPSQDSYKNQLTGLVYRMGRKEMGDITANFTIGRYDYVLKQSFMGGKVIFDDGSEEDDAEKIAEAAKTKKAVGWQRARGSVSIRKTLYALTDDDQLCVLSYVNLIAYEGDSDGAIGIVIRGTLLDPQAEEVAPEYWFDVSDTSKWTISDTGISPKA